MRRFAFTGSPANGSGTQAIKCRCGGPSAKTDSLRASLPARLVRSTMSNSDALFLARRCEPTVRPEVAGPMTSSAKQSSAQCKRPLDCFVASAPRNDEFSRSRNALSRASAVTPAMRSHERFRSPHRSSSEHAGGGHWHPHDQCFEPRQCKRKKKKESGTPKNADPYPLYLAVRLAPCKARSPIGVPPRLLPKGVIVPKAHLGPGFVGGRHGRVHRRRLATLPASTSRAGHSAGRHDTRSRPGAEVTSRRPRAPHPVPISQGHRLTSFTANGIDCRYSNRRGNVKANLFSSRLFKQIGMLRGANFCSVCAGRVSLPKIRKRDFKTM